MPLLLPPSANWYSSGALSSDRAGLVVSCSRFSLLLAAPRLRASPPCLRPLGVIADAHKERATGALVWRADPEDCEDGDAAVRVVSCGQDGYLRLWHCRVSTAEGCEDDQFHYTCHRQHNVHGTQPVVAVDRPRQAPQLVVSVDERGTFVVWDTVAHTTRRLQPERCAGLSQLRCSPHTELVVAVAGRRGLLWTVSLAAGGRVLQKLRGHDQDLTSISWCPELTSLLSVQQDHLLASAARDNTIRVWGVRSGRCHVTQPVRSAGGGGGGRDGDSRTWLALLWTAADCLYSSTAAGQLLRWRLSHQPADRQVVHSVHGRGLFNIVPLSDGVVVTSGIDRNLVVYDPAQLASGTVPTLGGAVHALHSCPVDPSRLAVGCADGTIRVWNLGSQADYAVTTLWQGVKGKVLTVAWHRKDDTRLAFGTEEGRVGVCHAAGTKPAVVCADHHRSAVYCVTWGPDGALYSLSPGEVWRHEPTHLSSSQWSFAAGHSPCSQLAFGAGGVALGRQDGSVQLLSLAGVVRAAALGHRRLVTALVWAPVPTGDGTTTLAVASYDHHISLFDVPRLDGSRCPPRLQARLTLSGHRGRVFGLAWSPHQPELLVSASQDTSARVWDTRTGAVRAVYAGHGRMVRCCLPHPLRPELVLSGGDDGALHGWRPDRQPTSLPEKPGRESPVDGGTAEDSGSVKNRKKEKKKNAKNVRGASIDSESTEADGERTNVASGQPRELGDGRKVRSQRSLFPLSATAENRGKAHSQADIDHLLDAAAAQEPAALDGGAAADADSGGEQRPHLGLFGDDAALNRLLDMEVAQHESQQAAPQMALLSVWRGDTARHLRSAAAQARLSDQLLALAPMVSYRFWQEMSIQYAAQLENEKEVPRASAVLLACHQVPEAIALLTRHRLYREALCVSRLRLPPHHPGHQQVLQLWAEHLASERNLEMAAKCYLAAGQPAAASAQLAGRADAGSLRLAARLSAAAGEVSQQHGLALQALHAGCMRAEWEAALAAAQLTTQPQAGTRLCLAHRLLVRGVERCTPRLLPWAARLLLPDTPPPQPTEQDTGSAAPDDTPPAQSTERDPASSQAEATATQNETELDSAKDAGESDPNVTLHTHAERGHIGDGDHCGSPSSLADQADGAVAAAASDVAGGEDRVAEAGGPGLLERLRQTWREAGVDLPAGDTQQQQQEQLAEVRFCTRPSTARQLWLSLAGDLCAAAARPAEDQQAALLSLLDSCLETVPAQLPPLCCLLLPADRETILGERDCLRLVLPAVLAILRQAAPSVEPKPNSQCEGSATGGVDDSHQDIDVEECVRRWTKLRGEDVTSDEQGLLSEITEQLERVL